MNSPDARQWPGAVHRSTLLTRRTLFRNETPAWYRDCQSAATCSIESSTFGKFKPILKPAFCHTDPSFALNRAKSSPLRSSPNGELIIFGETLQRQPNRAIGRAGGTAINSGRIDSARLSRARQSKSLQKLCIDYTPIVPWYYTASNPALFDRRGRSGRSQYVHVRRRFENDRNYDDH
jgi:hypothetical protein